MKPKDIFGLAVRLLGLWFLYLGMRAMIPLLDLGAIEAAGMGDIVNAILPVVFDFAVAWWLLGGRLLTRLAYPEPPGISSHALPQARQASPAPTSPPSPESANTDSVDKKLAALVDNPNTDRST